MSDTILRLYDMVSAPGAATRGAVAEKLESVVILLLCYMIRPRKKWLKPKWKKNIKKKSMKSKRKRGKKGKEERRRRK